MKTKARTLLAILLALSCSAVGFGTQITASQDSDCAHIVLIKVSDVSTPPTYVNDMWHTFETWDVYNCLNCGDEVILNYQSHDEAHNEDIEYIPYPDGTCARHYCTECGHVFYDEYIG